MTNDKQDQAKARFIRAGQIIAQERAKDREEEAPDSGREEDPIADTIEGLRSLNPG